MIDRTYLRWLAILLLAVGVGLTGWWFRQVPGERQSTRDPGGSQPAERAGQGRPRAASRTEPKIDRADIERLRAALADGTLRAGEKEAAQVKLARWYAERDPEAGIRWLQSMPPADWESRLLAGLLGEYVADARPQEWKTCYGLLASGAAKGAFLFGALGVLSKTDVRAAWQEFQTEKSSLRTPEAFEMDIFKLLSRRNPEQFWDVVVGMPQPPADHLAHLTAFFQCAEFKEPRLAMACLGKLTDAATRAACVEAYSRVVPPDQIEQFGAAIQQSAIFTPQERDAALATVANRAFHEQPEAAARLIQAIKDAGVREQLAQELRQAAASRDASIHRAAGEILVGE